MFSVLLSALSTVFALGYYNSYLSECFGIFFKLYLVYALL